MSVLHVNVPSFPIEIERLGNSRLRRRPVAIAASSSPRAPLLYVSPEAFAAGIHRGMAQRQARHWDHTLICLLPNERLYRRAQDKLLEVIARFTPTFEPTRLGSVFLDMTGMELLFGKAAEAASKLRSELLRQLHLDPALGVARNKLVSRVAAKVMRPHGLYQVYEGHEAEFLSPLPVEYLPGVGPITSGKLLRELSIHRIGELAEIPVSLLIQLFGKVGIELHDKALGEDKITISKAEKVLTKFLCRDQLGITFSQPTNDDHQLLRELWRLCERAGAALRTAGEMTSCVFLEGIYVDGQVIRQKRDYIPPTQSDFALFRPWRDHWRNFMERRLQLKSLTLTLQKLQSGFEQLDFAVDHREHRLLIALDVIRGKYGEKTVWFGR